MSVEVAPMDGSEKSIDAAAEFMVDSFWIQSPQQLMWKSASDETPVSEISDSDISSLVDEEGRDLMDKYGERMGKRKLEAAILAATDADSILGLVTIEVSLLDIDSKDIMSAKASEKMLTDAVSSLGPKQRREYRASPVTQIANELLPAQFSAVCSMSNLCVSSKARRMGVARKLCEAAERMAKEEWGFEELHLRVEASNEAATQLYETKLGYERKFTAEGAKALRIDASSGSFFEIDSEILVMAKTL